MHHRASASSSEHGVTAWWPGVPCSSVAKAMVPRLGEPTQGGHTPMVETITTASKDVASLVCGLLGCLGAAALPWMYSHGLRQEPTGVSAGIAVSCAGLLLGT